MGHPRTQPRTQPSAAESVSTCWPQLLLSGFGSLEPWASLTDNDLGDIHLDLEN